MAQQRSAHERKIWSQVDALQMGMDWDVTDIYKPQILIDDVVGDSHPGSKHLGTLSEQAAFGVYEKGGKPAHFHVTDICDGCAQGHDGMNYVLASREGIADMVQLHACSLSWDGAILISSCDKSIPAHLIAAARLDLPTVFIPGGSMRPAPYMKTAGRGGDVSLREKRGEITPEEVMYFKMTGCPSLGACQFLGTASTMQCVAEALGLALPGSALSPATMHDILNDARRAGRTIMHLIEKGIKASDVMSMGAFKNAIAVHAAIGGSTNALLHLPAAAREMGLNISADTFDDINRNTPYIGNIYPSGEHPTEAF